jgi:hypothetical protein
LYYLYFQELEKGTYTFFGCSNQEWNEQGMWFIWESWQVNKWFWWEYLRERYHLENKNVDIRIIIKWIFKTFDGEARTGLIWLRTETSGGRLWMRKGIFGFQKMWEIFWLAKDLVRFSGRNLFYPVNYL